MTSYSNGLIYGYTYVRGLWSSGDIRATFPGIISGYGFADGVTDVVYRGHLGYIPGFRVYVHYIGCETELLSSAGNITHSISVVVTSSRSLSRGIIYISLTGVGKPRGWPTHSGSAAMLVSS